MNKILHRFTPKTLARLIIRCVIIAVAAYGFVFLEGLIFDRWLHRYDLVTFIFILLMIVWAIGIALIVLSIVQYVKSVKHPETFAANQAAYDAEKAAKAREKAAEKTAKEQAKAAEKAEKEALEAAEKAEKAALEAAATEAPAELEAPEEFIAELEAPEEPAEYVTEIFDDIAEPDTIEPETTEDELTD